MKIKLLGAIAVIILFLSSGCQTNNNQGQKWSEKQAAEWFAKVGWLRGSDFIPSTAINQLEMWQKETFDTTTINRELGWAEGIGMNCMRVYVHHLAWQVDKEGFKDRMNQYLSIADRHGIKTIFVFFDDCWNPTYKPGKQPDPKPGIHNSGWVQDPGQKESADSTYFPILEKYVKDIIYQFGNDKRIVMWDLYNEPGNSGKADSSLNLLKHVFEWARSMKPIQPLTAGIWSNNLNLNNFQLENSDIISFHNYNPDSSMKAAIAYYSKYNRPLVCTEYMARTNGSRFDNILPLLKKERVGAINWGLVSGKTNTMYRWGDTTHIDGSEPDLWFHDIFRKDGTPYLKEETDLIKRECLNK